MNLLSKSRSNTPKKILLNEAPTVISMMSAVIENGGSLDVAVRDVVSGGPKHSSDLFKKVVDDADTRASSGIKDGLNGILSSLPVGLASFRRSLHMVIAASESGDRTEKARMLKDASDISLDGLKETGETYSASLNTPCMLVFGLGIMVPMIMMSILPMLNIGGLFSSSPIDPSMISIITLILIPAAVVAVMLSIKENNPFLSVSPGKNGISCAFPMAFAPPMAFILWNITGDIAYAVTISVAVSGAITALLLSPVMIKENLRMKQEQLLKDAVFELGNRLISGDNFDTALVEAIGVRKECKPVSEAIGRELAMCRGDVCSAISSAVGPISGQIAGILCDIYRCSLKDVRDAGRMAISVGRQLQDQETVRKGIQNKLKSMVDMMTGTAAVFAPMVLGMSIMMLGPLSDVSGSVDLSYTSLVLSVYIVELCVLMSFMTAYLNGRTDVRTIMFRMGCMMPVSMMVFMVCTSLSF